MALDPTGGPINTPSDSEWDPDDIVAKLKKQQRRRMRRFKVLMFALGVVSLLAGWSLHAYFAN